MFSEILLKTIRNYWYIWTLIFILAIILPPILKVFFPKVKGFLGEKSIALILSQLDSKKYKIINNLLIDNDDITSQIDHVIISNYGIFVIETKNFNGWIVGNEYSNFWTQIIYKRRERFYNPIKQNYAHIKALKIALRDFADIVFNSIIVFSSEADLKIKTNKDVINDVELIKNIKKYKKEIISDDIKDRIFSQLCVLKNKNKNLRKNHISNIKRKNK